MLSFWWCGKPNLHRSRHCTHRFAQYKWGSRRCDLLHLKYSVCSHRLIDYTRQGPLAQFQRRFAGLEPLLATSADRLCKLSYISRPYRYFACTFSLQRRRLARRQLNHDVDCLLFVVLAAMLLPLRLPRCVVLSSSLRFCWLRLVCLLLTSCRAFWHDPRNVLRGAVADFESFSPELSAELFLLGRIETSCGSSTSKLSRSRFFGA